MGYTFEYDTTEFYTLYCGSKICPQAINSSNDMESFIKALLDIRMVSFAIGHLLRLHPDGFGVQVTAVDKGVQHRQIFRLLEFSLAQGPHQCSGVR